MIHLGNGKGYFKIIKTKICGLICNLSITTFNKVVFQLSLQSKRQAKQLRMLNNI